MQIKAILRGLQWTIYKPTRRYKKALHTTVHGALWCCICEKHIPHHWCHPSKIQWLSYCCQRCSYTWQQKQLCNLLQPKESAAVQDLSQAVTAQSKTACTFSRKQATQPRKSAKFGLPVQHASQETWKPPASTLASRGQAGRVGQRIWCDQANLV